MPIVLCSALFTAALASSAPRTWRDDTGKFELEAELVSASEDAVTLRRADGREVVVPRDRLSRADQAFLRKAAARPDAEPARGDQKAAEAERFGSQRGSARAADDLVQMAEDFFADLRTRERTTAIGLLTADAQKLAAEGKSPLLGLPTPDKRRTAIRVRPPEIDRSTAAVPVYVQVNRQATPTKLHFRQEEEAWRVFAISALLAGGEKTIDFEVEPGAEGEADPIVALLGKPMPLAGLSMDGRRFDIRQLRGKVVLVDFWATWCGPCRGEMPNIAENYAKYRERGFEVVAVSLDRDMQSLQEFVGEQRPPWVVLADRHPQNEVSMSAHYGVRSIPAFALVGPDGTVVDAHCRGDRLGPAIEKALARVGAGTSNWQANAAKAAGTPRSTRLVDDSASGGPTKS
ncbi:MAG: redoxin family protein [Planctomycetota bacterium]